MLRKAFSFQIFALAVILITAPAMYSQLKVNRLSTDSPLSRKRPISRTQVRVDLDKAGSAVINGFGYMPGEPVDLNVSLISKTDIVNVPLTKWTVFADQNGAINSGWLVTGPNSTYSLTAVGERSFRQSSTTFAAPDLVDAEAANLDQCANGPADKPPIMCNGAAWQNGDLNANQAHYLEGESVPYRMRFSGLTVGKTDNTVTIEWDTTENSGAKHALDYLTDFDRNEPGADPCSGVTGCTLSSATTFAISLDPNVVAAGVTQIGGQVFTMYGGQITVASAYTIDGSYSGASKTRITLTFRSDVSNPVLAWGGHISTRHDWGPDKSAIAIPGAPYHMRLYDLNGKDGHQDRSLQSSAAIFPATVTIEKLVFNLDGTFKSSIPFEFQSSANFGTTSFFLTDNNPLADVGDSITNSSIVLFGAANAITVKELSPAVNRYSLSDLYCTEVGVGIAPVENTTWDLTTATANIIPDEGEVITCTFKNSQLELTAAPASLGGRVLTSAGSPIRGAMLQVTRVATGETKYSITGTFGHYQFDDLEAGEAYVITVNAKRYVFQPNTQLVELRDNVADLDFIALQK